MLCHAYLGNSRSTPQIKLFVQIDDNTEALLKDAEDYERAIRAHEPLPQRPQNPDDVYMLYTGGTTGLPKGVMYPQGAFAEFFWQWELLGES